MTFTKGNHTEKLTSKLKNTNIENVKEFKYLGITINKKNCSFQPNLKELIKISFEDSFNSKIRLTQVPVKVALNIFDAAILPTPLYVSEIWEPYLNQDYIKW